MNAEEKEKMLFWLADNPGATSENILDKALEIDLI